MRPTLRGALVGLALVVLVLAGPAAAGGMTTVDADHQLATDSAIGEYQSSGTMSASLVQLDMTVTVAESHSEVGLEGAGHTDFDSTYLRFEYREELSRTVRIYLPSEYFRPRPKDGLEAVESDVEATLEPVDGRNYTAVRVTFSGPTTAVFDVGKESGLVFGTRAGVKSLLSNRTGVELPSVRSSGQWSYVDTSSLEANTTVAVSTRGKSLTLQYDADDSTSESSWIKVPDCGDSEAPVCRFDRDGEEGRVYLLSRSTDVPEVRYKHGNDLFAGLKSSFADAGKAVDDVLDSVGSTLDIF